LKHGFFVALSIFICIFAEDNLLNAKSADINMYYIILEVISAYGNVGISMNLPGTLYSVSGNFGILAKLSICFAMLLGKHRDMPMVTDAVVDFQFKRLKKAVAVAQHLRAETKSASVSAANVVIRESHRSSETNTRHPLEIEKK
jgi:Trk-type K+ transport system membrane component